MMMEIHLVIEIFLFPALTVLGERSTGSPASRLVTSSDKAKMESVLCVWTDPAIPFREVPWTISNEVAKCAGWMGRMTSTSD